MSKHAGLKRVKMQKTRQGLTIDRVQGQEKAKEKEASILKC